MADKLNNTLAHQMADLMHEDGNGENYEQHLKTVADDNNVKPEAVHKACEAILGGKIEVDTRYPILKSQFDQLFNGIYDDNEGDK